MKASELIQRLVELVADGYDMEVVVGHEDCEIESVTPDGFHRGRAIRIEPGRTGPEIERDEFEAYKAAQ